MDGTSVIRKRTHSDFARNGIATPPPDLSEAPSPSRIAKRAAQDDWSGPKVKQEPTDGARGEISSLEGVDSRDGDATSTDPPTLQRYSPASPPKTIEPAAPSASASLSSGSSLLPTSTAAASSTLEQELGRSTTIDTYTDATQPSHVNSAISELTSRFDVDGADTLARFIPITQRMKHQPPYDPTVEEGRNELPKLLLIDTKASPHPTDSSPASQHRNHTSHSTATRSDPGVSHSPGSSTTAETAAVLIETDTPGGIDLANSNCVVCNDRSSGKHYGCITCEGCKSFFKRSVRRNLHYTCRAEQTCPVDTQHRNQCQACRFDKCLRVGMRKDAVQQGRSCSHGVGLSIVSEAAAGGGIIPPFGRPSNPFARSNGSSLASVGLDVAAERILASALRAETLSRCGVINSAFEEASANALRLLSLIVQWARNMTYFSNLKSTDQLALLRHSWPQLFLLNAAQHHLPLQICTLLAASAAAAASATNTHPDHPTPTSAHDLRSIEAKVEKLKSLRPDDAEFSCLRAILLFDSDAPGVEDAAQIDSYRTKAHAALTEYVRSREGAEDALRPGTLLLRIGSLQSISPQSIAHTFFLRMTLSPPSRVPPPLGLGAPPFATGPPDSASDCVDMFIRQQLIFDAQSNVITPTPSAPVTHNANVTDSNLAIHASLTGGGALSALLAAFMSQQHKH